MGKIVNKKEFVEFVKSNNHVAFHDETVYDGMASVAKNIYVLNKANGLVGYYRFNADEYMIMKPAKRSAFSKTGRKLVKIELDY